MNPTAAPASPTTALPRRRWPRYLLATLLVLIAVPTVLYQAIKWQSANDADSVMAELDRTDPNWRLDDLEASREKLSAEENSALFIIKLVAMGGASGTSRREFYEQFDNIEPQYELNALQVQLLQDAYANVQETLVEA